MRDHPMFKNVIECPETGDDRDECKCERCAEYRATLEELRRDREDEDWRRREQSRRVDREYVARRMPGEYKL
jgi:hypothetical protein